MNTRQRATLAAVFTDPAPANIKWKALESLFRACGCEEIKGSGSHVRFHRDGVIATFSRPHPGNEVKRYQVKAARRFLSKLGVTP